MTGTGERSATRRRPAGRRASHGDGPATRERILDTAESLFAQHGFDGTSTARIAAAAGIPQGLVFYYFGTKLDILLTIVRERPTPEDVVLAGMEPGQPTAVLLTRVLEAFVEELRRHRNTRVVLFREALLYPEIRERAEQLVAEVTGSVTDVLMGASDVRAERSGVEAAARLLLHRTLLTTILSGRDGDVEDQRDELALLTTALTCPA